MDRWTGLSLAICVIAGVAHPQDGSAPGLELSDGSFDTVRDRILATDEELKWRTLPWLTTYQSGLEQAAAQEKPLLLWVMNGHPFGCT